MGKLVADVRLHFLRRHRGCRHPRAGECAGGADGLQPAEPLDPPRLYLSCPQTCFEDYVKQRLSYFDFVRDPYLSDYTLVIVRQAAGGGGERFSLTIEKTGPSPAAPDRPRPHPSTCTTKPGASTDDTRREMLALLLRALLVELADTPHAAEFAVSLAERRLSGEQEKFLVGLSTSFFVFQAQRDLASARVARLGAELDRRLSLADLEAIQSVPLTPIR